MIRLMKRMIRRVERPAAVPLPPPPPQQLFDKCTTREELEELNGKLQRLPEKAEFVSQFMLFDSRLLNFPQGVTILFSALEPGFWFLFSALITMEFCVIFGL